MRAYQICFMGSAEKAPAAMQVLDLRIYGAQGRVMAHAGLRGLERVEQVNISEQARAPVLQCQQSVRDFLEASLCRANPIESRGKSNRASVAGLGAPKNMNNSNERLLSGRMTQPTNKGAAQSQGRGYNTLSTGYFGQVFLELGSTADLTIRIWASGQIRLIF